MPVQIIPQDEGIWGALGTGLGSGLQSGLQQLAQSNLQNMLAQKQQQQTQRGLLALGFDSERASALSGLDPQSLREVIKSQQRAPQEEAFAEALNQLLGVSQKPSVTDQQVTDGQPISEQKALPRLTEQQAAKLADLQFKKEKSIREERKITAKKEEEERKALQVKEAEVAKETLPTYKELNKEYKSAINNDTRLDRIETLTKQGKLGKPLFNSLLKTLSKGIGGFGIDLTGLMTADAQELDKLSTDFIREAKDIFGSRLTDADLKAFLRIIPTLSQSNSGRMRIIHNMRLFNAGIKVRKKAMDSVISENNGKRPFNLDQLIEERSIDELNDLAQVFEKTRPREGTAAQVASAVGPVSEVSTLGEGLLHY